MCAKSDTATEETKYTIVYLIKEIQPYTPCKWPREFIQITFSLFEFQTWLCASSVIFLLANINVLLAA